MGKHSHRPGRADRAARRRRRDPGGTDTNALEIVIATTPQSTSGAGVSLEGDVALVKSALLYADRVELISPGAAMLEASSAIADSGLSGLLDVLETLDPATRAAMGAPEFPPNLRQMIAGIYALDSISDTQLRIVTGGVGLTREQRATMHTLVTNGNRVVEEYRRATEDMLSASGADQLRPAVDAGILVLNPAGLGSSHATVAAAVDAAQSRIMRSDESLERFIALVLERMSDPRKHLMLDDLLGSIVTGLIDEGLADLSQPSARGAVRAAVGSGVIARLPIFPDLQVQDVLDLRSDLDMYLGRYRRAVADLSQHVAAGPFTDEVRADIDAVMRNHVTPALDDIRDEFASHSLSREFGRAMATDARAATTSAASAAALGLGIAPYSQVISWVALAASPAVAAVPALLRAIVSHVDNADTNATSRHDLYYLHRIEQAGAADLSSGGRDAR